MTHLYLNALLNEDGEDVRDTVFSEPPAITVSDIKDIFTCSRSREERLNTLYRIRSALFTYDMLDMADGYSPLIAEIDRALGLLEQSPIGTADPEVLQRVDHIGSHMLAC